MDNNLDWRYQGSPLPASYHEALSFANTRGIAGNVPVTFFSLALRLARSLVRSLFALFLSLLRCPALLRGHLTPSVSAPSFFCIFLGVSFEAELRDADGITLRPRFCSSPCKRSRTPRLSIARHKYRPR